MSDAVNRYRGWGDLPADEVPPAGTTATMRALRNLSTPIPSDHVLSPKETPGQTLSVPANTTVPKNNTVPKINTVPNTNTVPANTTVPNKHLPLYQSTPVVVAGTVPTGGIVVDQFTRVPNGIWDNVLPRLKPVEQVVVMRLYRLSRGFNTDTCRVGFNTLAKACNISKSTAQVTISRLIDLGLIEVLGVEQGGTNKQERGTIYRIKLPAVTVPRKTTVPRTDTVPTINTNKETHINETHTNTKSVCVGSQFSLGECRKYAEHLNSSGQGIINPGGYATKIHRSGEADDLIAAFLNPAEAAPVVDASQCPDCGGTGFWEPGGAGKGVAKCKHERIQEVELF